MSVVSKLSLSCQPLSEQGLPPVMCYPGAKLTDNTDFLCQTKTNLFGYELLGDNIHLRKLSWEAIAGPQERIRM